MVILATVNADVVCVDGLSYNDDISHYCCPVLLSPAGAVGPGTGDIATPPVRLSVRLSVRHV